MLIIFLLLGCVVKTDNLAFDYEDFDDQYSYDDDDNDEEVMVFPGFESARVRRYDQESVTRSQPDQKDIKGLLHQIMSGRKMEDFISDEPFMSKEETNQDNNYGSSTSARETYDIITPMTKDDRFSTINREYDNLDSPSNHITPVNTENYDNFETPSNDIPPVNTNHYDNLKTPINNITPANPDNYDNFETPINNITPVNPDNYDNFETPINNITPVNTTYNYDNLDTPINDITPVNTNNYDNVVTPNYDKTPVYSYNYDTVKTTNDYEITPITKGEGRFTTTSESNGNVANEYYNVTPATKVPPRSTLDWILQTESAMYQQDLMSYIQDVADETFRNELKKPTRIPTDNSLFVPERSSLKKNEFQEGLRNAVSPIGDDEDGSSTDTEETTSNTTTTELPTTTTVITTTTMTTTTGKQTTRGFDIEKFLEVIANLTYDYDTNLTMEVNETLKKMSWPTCALPTIMTTTSTTTELSTIPTTAPPDYAAINHTLIGKCFVCGLETEGIPYDANCADAFAGDFIPLVPQDPRAKGQIARFRKYCRYHDVDNYAMNKTMPRSIFGRWTGGCSVRWTDLSGVYTQRSCRNRFYATTGKHFASKRMAKLEMALSNLENGCIISPVATLLPLSRGISLFARFHACVCTGNWCNMAPRNSGLTAVIVIMLATVIITWMNET